MISHASAPSCGNAVALAISADGPWTLLRCADEDFADGVVTVWGGEMGMLIPVLDYTGLTNGVPAWYQVMINGEPSGEPVSVTPAYHPGPIYSLPDVAGLVRERLALGLTAELQAGRLTHVTGAIPVMSATPPLDQVKLPMVTVILTSRRPEVRGIGEMLEPDELLESGMVGSTEGWLDRSILDITVWSLNHEDRLRLRDAVQRVLMLNLPVFDAARLQTINISESDISDFERYGTPMHMSQFVFSCLHAALVRNQAPAIAEVHVHANETP